MENDVVPLVPLEDMALPDPEGWALGEPLLTFRGTRAFEARGGDQLGVAFVTHARGRRDEAQRRANVLARFAHPSLIPVIATGPVGPFVYRLDADAPGPTAPAHARLEGPLSADQVVELGLQLVHVLVELHARAFVHGRVEPSTVRIDVASGRALPVLCDAAATLEDGPSPASAPEIHRGGMPDPRADLFGLGLVLVSLLTGQTPEVNSEAQSGPACSLGGLSLDSRLHALLVSLVDADPARRPRSATEVEDALARLRGQEPAAFPWKPVAAGAVLVAVLGIAFAATRGSGAPEPVGEIPAEVPELVAERVPSLPEPSLKPAVEPEVEPEVEPVAPKTGSRRAASKPALEAAVEPAVEPTDEEPVVEEPTDEVPVVEAPAPEPVVAEVEPEPEPAGPDVSGSWSGQANGRPITFSLSQSGTQVSGQVTLQLGGQSQKASVSGQLDGARLVLVEQVKRGSTYTLQLSGSSASGTISADGRDRGTLQISR